jgi:hypothetical protein
MSATRAVFHTATIEQQVPGAQAEMAAVAYNLQYTKPLVSEFVEHNPPGSTDVQTVRIRDQDLVRLNMYGAHPEHPSRRLCVIGIGDDEERATRAANGAWFDYHASVLFADRLGDEETHVLSVRHRVPGVPAQRAATVGVAYDVEFMQPRVEAAVARNLPTRDELEVVQGGELTLMRVSLYGRHPLENTRAVCVGGIADRHYRAVVAAEQAWVDFHTQLLFTAQAIGSS